ncbi:conserved exported hypothetical protein [Gammaproteobacteria bacterium]
MKSAWRIVATAAVFCCMQFSTMAIAEDKIMVKGKISEYDVSKKTLVVAVDGSKDMTFVVQDNKALGMLDDQLFAGDEVKIRYIAKDGKNIISDPGDLKSARPGC